MKNFLIILILSGLPGMIITAQVPDIYFGAGNNNSLISVSGSSNSQLYPGTETAEAVNTVNGKGMLAKRMEASRFLSQAGFGGSLAMIDTVVNMGIEAWIDSQFVTPPTYYSDTIWSIWQQSKDIYFGNGNTGFFPSRPDSKHMDYAWWNNILQAKDILRQKVAYAFSQILVISSEGTLQGYGNATANYYDILVRNAFGNFYDMLYEVSIHPAMGIYLTHFENDKTDTTTNEYPDENYAREIMQLFTIGLDSLNLDGTPALDSNGQRIPTYDNNDIAEFAKIFTGLGAGDVSSQVNWTDEPSFGMGFWATKKDTFMTMYEDHHEPGEKHLLNGYIVPAGQSGMEDIQDAIQHLFDHPNVGPFISYRLIQRLVKSNPTPEYVAAVASVFNDNGNGVRGDLKAVVKAILMHPEARECYWINDPNQGQLREPILRKTQFINAIGLILSPLNNYWNYKYWFYDETDHHPLHSPTVFNFYKPGFTPNGPIEDAGNVAPEFEIYNSRTSIGFSRQVYRWVETDKILETSYYEGYEYSSPDLASLMETAKDPDALLDHLDVLLTQGNLSDYTRHIIKNTLNEYGTSNDDLDTRLKLATYLIMISPDFNIIK